MYAVESLMVHFTTSTIISTRPIVAASLCKGPNSHNDTSGMGQSVQEMRFEMEICRPPTLTVSGYTRVQTPQIPRRALLHHFTPFTLTTPLRTPSTCHFSSQHIFSTICDTSSAAITTVCARYAPFTRVAHGTLRHDACTQARRERDGDGGAHRDTEHITEAA